MTGVEVIGTAPDALAFNVFMNGRKEGLWLAPHLIEFLDYAPGTTMSVGTGSQARSWTPSTAGEWVETTASNKPASRPAIQRVIGIIQRFFHAELTAQIAA